MMSPGILKHPEHTIVAKRLDNRVEVYIDGDLIAQSTSAIKLLEADLDPVIYIPINDLKNIDLIKSSEYSCPFKGHAEFYTLTHNNKRFENAAWSYDHPFDEVQELTGRVAFSPDKIQEIRYLS
ncbi:MAG TPA: DUF427 domain-containing protein [Bacteriovoracaceae bacterium]|nr:DUF427 domain-containing protein [Bacteriovoracaceae bacterium]